MTTVVSNSSDSHLVSNLEKSVNGIDISHHNGTINWSKVKTDPLGIAFVFIKATQGVGYKDPVCLSYANGAKNAGLKIGYYHFASLNNNLDPAKDAVEEAKWFDSVIRTLPSYDLLPVLDIETNEKKLTRIQVKLWIDSFLSAMKIAGYPEVILYSYKPFLDENLPVNNGYGLLPLWLAQYRNVAKPSLPKGWSYESMWQYTDKGRVSGINGNCDLNKTSRTMFERITRK